MLRITKQTDYGIVLLTRLAAHPERVANAGELADEASLPAPMAAKILKILTREGILESHRGANGGYRLARPPEATSVADVISALEGPIAVTECNEEAPGLCEQEAFCPVRTNWNRINLAIHGALASISLAEMAGEVTSVSAPRLVTLGSGSGAAPQARS